MNESNISPQSLYYSSFSYKESNPDKSPELVRKARKIAEIQGQECFMLMCDQNICDTLIFYANRPVEALHIAIEASVAVNRLTCSSDLKGNVFRVVLDASLYCDPIGYESRIHEVIDLIEQELNPDIDLWRLMQWARAYLELAMLNEDQAIHDGLEYVQRSGNDHFRLADAFSFLCEAHYYRKEFDKILPYALQGEEHANRSKNTTKRWYIEHKAWQAFCYLRNGDKLQADTAYRLCLSVRSQIAAKPYPAFYDAICAYLELDTQYDESMRMRDKQLGECLESQSPYRITECRLRRYKLLKQMGQPFADEYQLAQQDASQLKKPEFFLKQLEQLK